MVQPQGGKWWRLAYRFGGKQKTLALGTYPATTLADARQRREDARVLLARGIDPGEHRKATKHADAAPDSFEAVAREWHSRFMPKWTVEHAARILQRLELNVFPWIGARPVGEIPAPEWLTVLRRIEARGRLETAHRAHQNCGAVFRYAVATGRAERDPSGDVRGALPSATKRHHAAIVDSKAAGGLLRVIDG